MGEPAFGIKGWFQLRGLICGDLFQKLHFSQGEIISFKGLYELQFLVELFVF